MADDDQGTEVRGFKPFGGGPAAGQSMESFVNDLVPSGDPMRPRVERVQVDDAGRFRDPARAYYDPIARVAPTSPVVVTIGGKSDADKAAEFKRRADELLTPIIALLNDAKREGFVVNFQLSPPDAFGRHSVAVLDVLKKF